MISAKYSPIMLDLVGIELTQEEQELLSHPLVGGVILFSRNYESKLQLQGLLQEIREVRPELVIAVDQEGGRVQRLQKGFTRLPPPAEFGRFYQADPIGACRAAEQDGFTMANELLAIGIDFSFAPVLDINHGVSAVIGDRSFATDPQAVIALAGAYIRGMQRAGMAAVGKHFPGHGAVTADSHHELPIDDRDYITIADCDLLPYMALGKHLAGIMTAHVIYQAVDNKPATFSPHWLQTVLRKQLQYKGVVFSDDLAMAGACISDSVAERAQLALSAGCDVVLICNDRQGAIEVLDQLQGNIINKEVQYCQSMLRAHRLHFA